MSALLFLYREVLGRGAEWGVGLIPAVRPARLPVVLTRGEVAMILGRLHGPVRLVCELLYGAGLRLLEALTLRVKDIDEARGEIRLRDGKGRKDRVTVLPSAVRPRLREQMSRCVRSMRPTLPPAAAASRCRRAWRSSTPRRRGRAESAGRSRVTDYPELA